jgi:hypothetical protein
LLRRYPINDAGLMKTNIAIGIYPMSPGSPLFVDEDDLCVRNCVVLYCIVLYYIALHCIVR